jgi:hypothetical protein
MGIYMLYYMKQESPQIFQIKSYGIQISKNISSYFVGNF